MENETLKNVIPAGCKDAGYTGDAHCVIFYVKISLESVVPKTDNHTYDNGTVTKPATATATGGELRYEF